MNNKILLINYDENHQLITDDIIIDSINSFGDKIISNSPYLIIVTTQNSLSRTNKHFQHILGEKLKMGGYKVFSKIDAIYSIPSIFSLGSKPYNVRTRIYYDPDKTDFIDTYNSNNKKNYPVKNNDKILITNYKVKRYTDINHGKEGIGKIIFVLICKFDGKEYKLIISNNCNYKENNSNNIKLNKNNKDKIKIIYDTIPGEIKRLCDNKIMTIQLNKLMKEINIINISEQNNLNLERRINILEKNNLTEKRNTLEQNNNILHRNTIISKIKRLTDIIPEDIKKYYTSINKNLIIRHMTLFKIIDQQSYTSKLSSLRQQGLKKDSFIFFKENKVSIFLNSLYRDNLLETKNPIPFKSILIAKNNRISSGSFATVYLQLFNDELKEIPYVLRLVRNEPKNYHNKTYGILEEKNKNKILNIKNTLIKSQEMEIIGLLFNIGIQVKYKNDIEKIKYIPYIYEFGVYNDDEQQYFYSIMKKYSSVESFLSKYQNVTFNMKNIVLSNILLKLLNSIKLIHDEGFIHCDIKPINLLIEDKQKINVNEKFEESFDLKINDFGAIRKIDEEIMIFTQEYLFSDKYDTAMQYNDLHAFFVSFNDFLKLLKIKEEDIINEDSINIKINNKKSYYCSSNGMNAFKYNYCFYNDMNSFKYENINFIVNYKTSKNKDMVYNNFISKIKKRIEDFKDYCTTKNI